MNVKIDITGKNVTTQTSSDKVNDSKEGTELLYKRYCECRDQELERFWENSKYVWTFLAICFAGYGVLLTSDSEMLKKNFVIFGTFISFIGIILSHLWLKMTQASKTWYEVYENAIWEMESYYNKFDADKRFLIHNFWASKKGKEGYSPSKIMLVIGKLLIGIWLCALFFSLLQLKVVCIHLNRIVCPCLLMIIGIALYVLLTEYLSNSIVSTAIRTAEEEKIFKKIKQDIYSLNKYIYFEIKEYENVKYVVFKFSEENISIIDNIRSIFPEIEAKWDEYDCKYKFADIEKHYENKKNGKDNKIKKIYNLFNVRRIYQIGSNIEVYTSEIDADFEVIKRGVKEDEKNKITKEYNNKIVIPLDCIKCE